MWPAVPTVATKPKKTTSQPGTAVGNYLILVGMDVKSPVKSHISEELFNVHVHNRLNQTGSRIIRSFSVWFPVLVWCFLLLRLRIFSAAFGLQTVPHYSCRMSGRGTKRHFIQDRLNRNRPVCWDGLKCIMGLRPIRSDQIRSSGLPR